MTKKRLTKSERTFCPYCKLMKKNLNMMCFRRKGDRKGISHSLIKTNVAVEAAAVEVVEEAASIESPWPVATKTTSTEPTKQKKRKPKRKMSECIRKFIKIPGQFKRKILQYRTIWNEKNGLISKYLKKM